MLLWNFMDWRMREQQELAHCCCDAQGPHQLVRLQVHQEPKDVAQWQLRSLVSSRCASNGAQQARRWERSNMLSVAVGGVAHRTCRRSSRPVGQSLQHILRRSWSLAQDDALSHCSGPASVEQSTASFGLNVWVLQRG